MVVLASSNTQPGRKLALEARAVKYLCDEFGMNVTVPKLWTDSSAAKAAGNRLGHGRKLKHVDVTGLYAQELIKAKQVAFREARRS